MRTVFLVVSLGWGIWFLVSVWTSQPTVEKIYPLVGMFGFYIAAKLEEI